MRVTELGNSPIHEILYLNARPKGGADVARLPVLTGRVEGLPPGLDALLLTSDLQGVVPSWASGGAGELLGEALADEIYNLSMAGDIPHTQSIGVILAGDFYSAPGGDKRGASGDVCNVWYAFSTLFAWVAGVAGNHDRFGSERDRRRLESTPNVHILDGDVVELDGLAIGGVSHIIGNPKKPGRRSADDFLASLNRVMAKSPALVVLHEGPNGDNGQPGQPPIRETLERHRDLLTVCGHTHWPDPLASLGDDLQALNVDARAVILTR